MIKAKEDQIFKSNFLNDFRITNTASTLILVLVTGMLVTTFFIIFDFHESYNFFRKEYYKLLHDYCLWKCSFYTQQEFLDKFHII